jgi:hypothetical protein
MCDPIASPFLRIVTVWQRMPDRFPIWDQMDFSAQAPEIPDDTIMEVAVIPEAYGLAHFHTTDLPGLDVFDQTNEVVLPG